MISTKHQHQRSNLFQDSTVLSIRFEVVNCMSVDEDEKPVNSHRHCPSSVQCSVVSVRGQPLFPRQYTSPYKLYSLPRCIVLNLNLRFGPGKVSDRDSNSWLTCSARHQSESSNCHYLKGAGEDNVPSLHTEVSICHRLHSCCAESDSNSNFCRGKQHWRISALGWPRLNLIVGDLRR